MRALLLSLLALAAACGDPRPDGTCSTDADCGGDVCARDMLCFPADEVHAVTVHWTIDGAAPTATSCAALTPFEVGYSIGDDDVSRVLFDPVPCDVGAFPIDKWPKAYTTAVVVAHHAFFTAPIAPDDNASVTIDLTVPPASP